jgi:hypothetical protein
MASGEPYAATQANIDMLPEEVAELQASGRLGNASVGITLDH